jgi:hypothetical protein
MKHLLVFAGLMVSASLLAARESKVLLMAHGTAPTSPATRAIVDDVKISADAITYDAAAKALRCEGSVSVETKSGMVKTTACTIELSSNPSVYVLNPHGITVGAGAAQSSAKLAAEASATRR